LAPISTISREQYENWRIDAEDVPAGEPLSLDASLTEHEDASRVDIARGDPAERAPKAEAALRQPPGG
jgi:hypothetical protein